MESDLYQVIYASAETRPMQEDELLGMLKLAREKNKRLGITGMLLHCDGSFIQALEGPKDQVMDLINVIRQDPRHDRIAVLFEGPIKKTEFFPVVDGVEKTFARGTCHDRGLYILS